MQKKEEKFWRKLETTLKHFEAYEKWFEGKMDVNGKSSEKQTAIFWGR